MSLASSPAAYLDPGYAASLAEFGEPVLLPQSQGWLLKRQVAGAERFDAMGCYPYLACAHWDRLADDLRSLEGVVSVAAAPDPFGAYDLADLKRAFPDRLVAFKTHHVADLARPLGEIVSRRRLRYAEKALRQLTVEFHAAPEGLLDVWSGLFRHAVQQFGLKGVRAYSPAAMEQQFRLEGSYMAIASHESQPVAAHIWMLNGGVAHAHLAAPGPRAHEFGAAYALYHRALEFFVGKAAMIDWGGEAGVSRQGQLGVFKAGWSTGTRQAYFGGRILDLGRYGELCEASGKPPESYFPAYRAGEFG